MLDSGATNNEKDLNLSLSLLLRDYLESYGAIVYMSRTTDEFISLEDRYTKANNLNADLFVSVHHNSSNFFWKNGATVIYPNNHDTEISSVFAERVNSTFAEYTSLKYNDVYLDVRGLAVLRVTHMPAILTELGYMSSNKDMEYIINNQ